jgi:TolB-like protein
MARKAVAVDPTNEEAVRELMRALADSGQRAQAVLEYGRCRTILRSRLDLEPAAETQRLHRDLRRGLGVEQLPPTPATARHLTQRIEQMHQGARAMLHTEAVGAARTAKDETGPAARGRDFVAALAADVLPQIGGRMVEDLGEGMLLEFADARSAAAAAFAIQTRCRRLNQGADPGKHVHLRMGIEVGEAITDRQGGCGVGAARLVSTLAGPGETVITANARDHLTPALDADVEDLGDCYPQGAGRPVRAYRIGPPGPHRAILSAPSQGRLIPTIAVIPFVARTPSVEHDVVGEVLANELIRTLSFSRSIDVISRLSTTVFRRRAASIAEISGHLDANYVLSGIYRTDDRNITLDLELSEARSERIVWSERLKDGIAGIFRDESELINHTAASVCGAILASELRRARSQPLESLESYALLMAAIALMHRNSLSDFQESHDMLQAVLERAPRQAIPAAWLANWHVLRVQQGWSEDIASDGRIALDYSRRSVDADPSCSLALVVDGFVHTNLLKRLDIGLEQYDLAIEANPNEALAWLLRGTLHAFMGEGDVAVENTQRALRLTPLDPHRYYYDSLSATACLAANQYDRALELANRSLRANRNKTSTLRAKAVAQWQLGHCDAARATAQELLKLEPGLTIRGWLSRSPSADYPIGATWAAVFRELGVPN